MAYIWKVLPQTQQRKCGSTLSLSSAEVVKLWIFSRFSSIVLRISNATHTHTHREPIKKKSNSRREGAAIRFKEFEGQLSLKHFLFEFERSFLSKFCIPFEKFEIMSSVIAFYLAINYIITLKIVILFGFVWLLNDKRWNWFISKRLTWFWWKLSFFKAFLKYKRAREYFKCLVFRIRQSRFQSQHHCFHTERRTRQKKACEEQRRHLSFKYPHALYDV